MKELKDDISELMQSDMYKPEELQHLSDPEIIWCQHQLILKQKKEIFELKQDLIGNNTSLNQNY